MVNHEPRIVVEYMIINMAERIRSHVFVIFAVYFLFCRVFM